MRLPQVVLLSGVAALMLTGIARAESEATHVMTLRLPNGQVEQIRYSGDVPPTVTLAPGFVATSAAMAADPFVMLRRIAAEMDQQTEALMRSISAMPLPGDSGLLSVAAGPGVCMRSVQITYAGNGAAPHVVSRTSGDCGVPAHHAAPVMQPEAPSPAPAVRTWQVKDASPRPYEGMIQTVSTSPR